MGTLYYVVEKHTSERFLNGTITITVYVIDSNRQIKTYCELNTSTLSPYTYQEEIQEYLDEEGVTEDFNFIKL